jgi:threonine/homoserine/homoserine lactone efflux protein
MTTMTLALMLFAMTVTPGPNNALLLYQASTRGFRAGLPLAIGIAVGGCVTLALSWVLLDRLQHWLPGVASALSFASFVLLSGMAILLWRQDPNGREPAARIGRIGPWSMAAFQLVNPKGWSFLGSLVAIQASQADAPGIGPMAITFVATSLACSVLWLGAGRAVERWVKAPSRRRAFNRGMSVVLLATAAWAYLGQLKEINS